MKIDPFLFPLTMGDEGGYLSDNYQVKGFSEER
jgi:hypothetical protein